MAYDILIVDDETDINNLIAGVLKDEGYVTRCALDGISALSSIEKCRPNLIILDIWLGNPKLDGLKLLEIIHSIHPDVPVIMMSGHGTVQTAVKAIKMGAYDFIEKPFKSDRLLFIINRAIESARLERENKELKKQFAFSFNLIGDSNSIVQIRQTISKVSQTNSRVLLLGSCGTGKRLIARKIHEQSSRSNSAFVDFNCSVFNKSNFEEKLFGREDKNKLAVGALEQANLGTLFLKEVTDMPMDIQTKFVKVLHEQKFFRINGDNEVETNVRIIAATTKNILEEIQKGNFLKDLYHRLKVVALEIPDLKDRSGDVKILSEYFINYFMDRKDGNFVKIDDDAVSILKKYDWPGNVHQLRNMMEWIKIMNKETKLTITLDMFPVEIKNIQSTFSLLKKNNKAKLLSLPLRKAREEFEKNYLVSQIDRFSGNITRTANFIGMERSALHRKLRLLKLDNE